jgi:RsiW-degrading membrane proteinase PrsW (M82 family)
VKTIKMNEILDKIEEEKIVKKTFSILSFGMTIVIFTLFLYFNSLIPTEIKASDGFKNRIPENHEELAIVVKLSCMLGFVFSILSFVKKEPSSLIKWIGAIINILIFLLIVGITIITLGLDKQ